MPSYLERYVAGEYEAVWRELTAMGSAVRQEPLYSDALAVAREMMRRARANILELQARLGSLGYRFGYNGLRPASCFFREDRLDAPPWFRDPDPDITKRIETLEDWQGPLPLSLRAWYEQIDAVNFVGMAAPLPFCVPVPHEALMSTDERRARAAHEVEYERDPALELDSDVAFNEPEQTEIVLWADPLWIAPFPSLARILTHRDEWKAPLTYIELAPDYVFKHEGAGGGGAYYMTIPNADADALFLGEGFGIPFVDYLRLSIRWAGFPGMRLWPRPPLEAIKALTDGLQPF